MVVLVVFLLKLVEPDMVQVEEALSEWTDLNRAVNLGCINNIIIMMEQISNSYLYVGYISWQINCCALKLDETNLCQCLYIVVNIHVPLLD